MDDSRLIWARARDGLAAAVTSLGFPAELADLMAKELGSPKAISRMAGYVRQARPKSEETLIDEMLAIRADIDAWRERKESREAQARYNSYLYYKKMEEDDEE